MRTRGGEEEAAWLAARAKAKPRIDAWEAQRRERFLGEQRSNVTGRGRAAVVAAEAGAGQGQRQEQGSKGQRCRDDGHQFLCGATRSMRSIFPTAIVLMRVLAAMSMTRLSLNHL